MSTPFEQTGSPTPEHDPELKALLDEHASTMSPRIEAALAEKDASLAEARAFASQRTIPAQEVATVAETEPEPAAAISGDVVHSRSSRSAQGIDDQKVKAVRRHQDPNAPRGKKRRERGKEAAPASADASVPTDSAESTMNAPQESAPAQVEAEPLAEGKYRDVEGQLLQVFKQGEEYWYKLLEGEDEGQLLQMSGDESTSWQKVDDSTEPAVQDRDEANQETRESLELQSGNVWIKRENGKIVGTMMLLEPIGSKGTSGFRVRIVSVGENGKANSVRFEHKTTRELQNQFEQEGYVRELKNMNNKATQSPARSEAEPDTDTDGFAKTDFMDTTLLPVLEEGLEGSVPEGDKNQSLDVDLRALEKNSLMEMLAVGDVWERGLGEENKLGKEWITIRKISGDVVSVLDEVRYEGEASKEIVQSFSREQLADILRSGMYARLERVPGEEKEEEPKPEAPEMTDIERLYILLDEARLAYVSTDYHQNSAWMKVKRFFGKSIGDKPGDADTKSKRETYELTLTKLQEAQLAILKKENLPPQALRERMAGMLKFYQYDERISLAKTRDQVKIENGSGLQRVVSVAERIGRAYNAMPRKMKFAIGAGLALGSGGLALAGATTAAGIVAGFSVVRKLAGTAGVAMVLDAQSEKWLEQRNLAASEKERNGDLEELVWLQEKNGDYFNHLDQWLKGDIKNLERKFQKDKRQTTWRKAVSWAGGGAFMLSSSLFGSYLHGAEHHGGNGGDGVQSEKASLPGKSVSAPAGSTPESRIEEVVPGKEASLLQEHDVVAADGKRGLWGILDQRLPADMATADKSRVIASLENIMRQKLDAMTPEERAAAGFPKGLPDGKVNLDFIRPGDKIDFGKLLTKEEIQSVLNGELVDGTPKVSAVLEHAPKTGTIGADASSAINVNETAESTATPSRTPLDEALFENKIAQAQATLMVPLDQAMPDTTELVHQAVFEDQANFPKLSNPQELRAFLAQNPDRVPLPEFTRTLGVMRRDIFLTPELTEYNPFTAQFDYTTHPNMGQVNMVRALEGARNLRTGVWQEYTLNRSGYPLHATQIRSLERLVIVAQDPKVFGSLGLPQAQETIDQYTRRIAAMTVALHKEQTLALLMRRGNSLV